MARNEKNLALAGAGPDALTATTQQIADHLLKGSERVARADPDHPFLPVWGAVAKYGHARTEAAMNQLRKEGKIRYVPVSDNRSLTPAQHRNTIEGVNESIAYVRLNPHAPK